MSGKMLENLKSLLPWQLHSLECRAAFFNVCCCRCALAGDLLCKCKIQHSIFCRFDPVFMHLKRFDISTFFQEMIRLNLFEVQYCTHRLEMAVILLTYKK